MLEILKALADPSRLRLTGILLRGEFTVQELTRILGTGQSRVSHHLKVLTEAGILSVKRQGTWSYYRVGGDAPFFSAIRPALEEGLARLPEQGQDLAAVAAVLEERRNRSRLFFDAHARQWDDLARTLLPVPEYRDRLLELIPDGASIVEIGLGTGGLLPALTAKGCRVIGVDHSPAMLEEARCRLVERGVKGVELRLGEMTHLPLPDRSADCALLAMVLHHAADPPAVLAESRRVLAPGGCLVLADLARHEREWAREHLADQWLGFDEGELRGWLTVVGFSGVDCERIEGGAGQEAVVVVKAYGPSPSPLLNEPPPCPLLNEPPPCPLLNEEGEYSTSRNNSSSNTSPPDSGGAGGGNSGGAGGGNSGGAGGQAGHHIHNTHDLKPLRQTLRNAATPAEQKLWGVLRHSNLGDFKFRRQHSVGRYVLDFYCPAQRLAIELDGDSHFTDEAMVYDRERTTFLNNLNIRVLRFLNSDVHENLNGVCERILEELTTPYPPPESGGGNQPPPCPPPESGGGNQPPPCPSPES